VKTIEEYAIELVADAAESCADRALVGGYAHGLGSDNDLLAAIYLACDIAHAIRANPQAVLALVGARKIEGDSA
jgi:hypothetical protein